MFDLKRQDLKRLKLRIDQIQEVIKGQMPIDLGYVYMTMIY